MSAASANRSSVRPSVSTRVGAGSPSGENSPASNDCGRPVVRSGSTTLLGSGPISTVSVPPSSSAAVTTPEFASPRNRTVRSPPSNQSSRRSVGSAPSAVSIGPAGASSDEQNEGSYRAQKTGSPPVGVVASIHSAAARNGPSGTPSTRRPPRSTSRGRADGTARLDLNRREFLHTVGSEHSLVTLRPRFQRPVLSSRAMAGLVGCDRPLADRSLSDPPGRHGSAELIERPRNVRLFCSDGDGRMWTDTPSGRHSTPVYCSR